MANANPKLNQIIAIEDGTKKLPYADLTKTHQQLQKTAQFNGFFRKYASRQEDGVKYPDEKVNIQQSAVELVGAIQEQQAEMLNVVATKDWGNAEAKANVTLEGDDKPLLTDVPVTYLIWLEKKLGDLRTFIRKLPKLDPTKTWTYDPNKAVWASDKEEQVKTKKVPKVLVKYEHTEQHPAQTEVYTMDEIEGTWTRQDLSTAYPAKEIVEMDKRLTALEKAVRFARVEANGIEVKRKKTGSVMLAYIFDNKK